MEKTSTSPAEVWRRRLRQLGWGIRRTIPFVGGMLTVVAGIFIYNLLMPGPRPLTQQDINNTVAQAMASATPPPAFSATVYQAIQPSLVLIQSQDATAKDSLSLGSGVIIDDRGDILTALHVVANTQAIQITFADGSQSSAQVTGKQPENDIAVLQADQPPAKIFPATLGNPKAMRVGDEAFVVGNPFGLYSSMSSGVISGFDRSFTPPDGSQPLKGLIQIDAAVNPGNSGGPLLNRSGQVVGIVNGIVNPTGQDVFIGVGFAVPIDVAGGAVGSPPY